MLDGGMNRLVAHRKASDAVRHHERLERRPPEGPGPQGLLWSGQPKLSRRAMNGRPACRVVSPQPQRLSGTAKI